MPQSIEDQTRKRVSEFLPEAIRKTLDSYHEFVGSEINNDAREFSAHHSACKVAIAHLELLLKLARWADVPDQKQDDSQVLVDLMREAQAELQSYQQRHAREEE